MIFVIGYLIFIVSFIVFLAVLPSKKYMSDIYKDINIRQTEQTKILKDVRNTLFSNQRKNKKGGK